ncbi:unnamed protein product [Cladocopium goreaui]|uniref:F-box domain-containing protein n=1 Tax=Cladocopium goreaui TaxID=2562237 RepID=A0A9P1FUH1_9DINO|nr:unnamed protein product [Cladocopium goreaui]
MGAPSTMLPISADNFEVPLGCKNLRTCNIQMCNFVREILNFHTATEEHLLAVCNCLPMRELRAFSLLARSFRAASTLAWSEDVIENERILLSIAQKDQPEFLAKAVTDSGISKASLGRTLLQEHLEHLAHLAGLADRPVSLPRQRATQGLHLKGKEVLAAGGAVVPALPRARGADIEAECLTGSKMW